MRKLVVGVYLASVDEERILESVTDLRYDEIISELFAMQEDVDEDSSRSGIVSLYDRIEANLG